MNELRIINEQTVLNKQFKVYGSIQEPLFLARDVAEWIDYDLTSVNKLVDSVDDDEKLNGTIFRSGQQRQAWFLTENGLYEVLMQSRKPIAKVFKKEVKKILKELRLYGQYRIPQTLSEALRLAADQQALIEAQKPKVLFAESVETSHQSILIGDLAKLICQNGIDIGQNRLFEILRNKGYLIKHGDSRNMPTQRSMELGIMEVKERTVNNPDGSVRITKTTKITGKGQIYFINKFLSVRAE